MTRLLTLSDLGQVLCLLGPHVLIWKVGVGQDAPRAFASPTAQRPRGSLAVLSPPLLSPFKELSPLCLLLSLYPLLPAMWCLLPPCPPHRQTSQPSLRDVEWLATGRTGRRWDLNPGCLTDKACTNHPGTLSLPTPALAPPLGIPRWLGRAQRARRGPSRATTSCDSCPGEGRSSSVSASGTGERKMGLAQPCRRDPEPSLLQHLPALRAPEESDPRPAPRRQSWASALGPGYSPASEQMEHTTAAHPQRIHARLTSRSSLPARAGPFSARGL